MNGEKDYKYNFLVKHEYAIENGGKWIINSEKKIPS